MPKLYILIAPTQSEDRAWTGWLGNGWLSWNVTLQGALDQTNGQNIAVGTLDKIFIVGHGGNQNDFLHLGVNANNVGAAIKNALQNLPSGQCEFRVQICNAGTYPNPPFLSQVLPTGVAGNAPALLSYIDRNRLRRIDLVALQNFGVDPATPNAAATDKGGCRPTTLRADFWSPIQPKQCSRRTPAVRESPKPGCNGVLRSPRTEWEQCA